MRQIHICEVGPRDGLQNAHHLMPTEAKKAWIASMAAAGIEEIEVGSFVPPKLIPAMADTAEIVAFSLTIPESEGGRAGAQREGLRARRRGGRAQGHVSGVRVARAQPRQRAHDARADGRRGAQVRAAARQEPGRKSRPASPPRSAAPCRAKCPRTTWCGSR